MGLIASVPMVLVVGPSSPANTAAFADVQPLHEALLATRPDRLLWGSDWPHTNPHAAPPAARVLMDCFTRWTPPPLRAGILWGNPKGLYGL